MAGCGPATTAIDSPVRRHPLKGGFHGIRLFCICCSPKWPSALCEREQLSLRLLIHYPADPPGSLAPVFLPCSPRCPSCPFVAGAAVVGAALAGPAPVRADDRRRNGAGVRSGRPGRAGDPCRRRRGRTLPVAGAGASRASRDRAASGSRVRSQRRGDARPATRHALPPAHGRRPRRHPFPARQLPPAPRPRASARLSQPGRSVRNRPRPRIPFVPDARRHGASLPKLPKLP